MFSSNMFEGISSGIGGTISRRLQSMPAGVDFSVVVGISLILFGLMRIMKYMTERRKRMMRARIEEVKALRNLYKDGWRNKNGYSWDIVILFDIRLATDNSLTDEQKCNNMKYILNCLSDGGVETKLFYNVNRKLVYCKLRCDYARLKQEADRINFSVQLDPYACEAALAEGRMEGDKQLWKGVSIPSVSEDTNYLPCDAVFAPFVDDYKFVNLYKRYGMNEVFFRGADRMKLMMSIIKARKYEGGCNLDLRKLAYTKCINDYIFLHDVVELRELEEVFLTFVEAPWKMAVNECKDYFGEKIGFYFLFLSHYTTWLGYAAFFGFISYCDVSANDGNPNTKGMPVFAVIMAMWGQLFLEFWKRKQYRYAMEWGMENFEEEAQVRAEFVGEMQPDPVKGKEYLYFPRSSKMCRGVISSVIIFFCVGIVCGVVASIFIMELSLRNNGSAEYQGMNQSKNIAAAANVLQIQILNAIYSTIAKSLNDYENHRTDNEYEDSLIGKTFVFQFVNSFAALGYLAFVKPFIQQVSTIYYCTTVIIVVIHIYDY
jgi:hypothetical protein